MLLELRVRDLGVIGDLTLLPGPGMTVLTGETGAGKTLVVGALALVLGGRATGSPVRRGAEEAQVEARFLLPADPADPAGAEPSGHPDAGPSEPAGAGASDPPAGADRAQDRQELVLARALPASGRSRAWQDGRMATAAQLAGLARELVDIHGQHDQHSLVSPAGRRRTLDTFAGADPAPVRRCARAVEEIDRQLAALGGDGAAQAREADVLRYQLAEIEDARIVDPEEDRRLAAEEERLADVEAHREAVEHAVVALMGDEAAEAGARHGVEAAIGALEGRQAFGDVVARLRDVAAELDDATRELRSTAEGLDDDPDRLAAVQARRQLLAQLRRKYGPELGDVRDFAESVRQRLAELAGAEARTAELATARERAVGELAKAQEALRAARVRSAPLLSSAATARVRDLAMPRASLIVTVGDHPAGDDVEILFTADAGPPDAPNTSSPGPTPGDTPTPNTSSPGPTPGDTPTTDPGSADPTAGSPGDTPSTGPGSGRAPTTRPASPAGEPPQPLARVASGGELARAALALRLVAVSGPDTMVFDEVDAGVGGEAAVALATALREVADRRQVLVVTHLPQVAARADVHVALRKVEDRERSTTVAEVLGDAGRVVELARMLSGHPDSETARAHAEELLTGARHPTAGTRQRTASAR